MRSVVCFSVLLESSPPPLSLRAFLEGTGQNWLGHLGFTFKSSLSHKLVTLELGRQEFLMFFSFFLNLFLKFLLVYWGPCISKCEWEIIIGMGVKNN